MNTKLLPVTPESLAEAGEIIRAGGLVGFPTETASYQSPVARGFGGKMKYVAPPAGPEP